MPYAKLDNITECVETGRTMLTALLSGRASDLKAIEEHPHWDAFKQPGHLQEGLDAGCVEFLGLTDELVVHLMHQWPPIGLDVTHQAIVNAVLDRLPIRFSWRPAKGPETSVSAGHAGHMLDVRIFSPVPDTVFEVRQSLEVAQEPAKVPA